MPLKKITPMISIHLALTFCMPNHAVAMMNPWQGNGNAQPLIIEPLAREREVIDFGSEGLNPHFGSFGPFTVYNQPQNGAWEAWQEKVTSASMIDCDKIPSRFEFNVDDTCHGKGLSALVEEAEELFQLLRENGYTESLYDAFEAVIYDIKDEESDQGKRQRAAHVFLTLLTRLPAPWLNAKYHGLFSADELFQMVLLEDSPTIPYCKKFKVADISHLCGTLIHNDLIVSIVQGLAANPDATFASHYLLETLNGFIYQSLRNSIFREAKALMQNFMDSCAQDCVTQGDTSKLELLKTGIEQLNDRKMMRQIDRLIQRATTVKNRTPFAPQKYTQNYQRPRCPFHGGLRREVRHRGNR